MIVMNKACLKDCELTYKIFGSGKVNLVIEMGLGAAAGEWWQVAQHLSDRYTVLLYERNKSVKTERTPENIARELFELLQTVSCEERIVLLAHSQGGLYAQQFARLYPDMVRGVVLLDPLSANDNRYKEVFTPKEQKLSGFDKSANLVIMKRLADLHMGFLIKALMKNAPPFYYYRDFSKDAADYILNSLTKSSFHSSALEEYRLAHTEQYTRPLAEKSDFPNIPLALVTHSSEFSIKEIMEFGHTSLEFAEKVEQLWQSLMKEYLQLSSVNKYIQANSSGHFIHLSEPQLIDESLLWIEGGGEGEKV